MRTIPVLVLFFMSIIHCCMAQPTKPTIQWQKALGGTSDDNITHAFTGPDGSSVLCGQVVSVNGDVTGNHGGYDGWITKLDASGNLVWQKAYGGTKGDGIFSIKQTADGYIMAGYNISNDGDATSNHGSADGWVIKTDNWGIIQWQKSIGGTKEDVFDAVTITTDGGYILAGRSFSNDGDLTQNYGLTDGWLVKLNSGGTIQWQQIYGGSNAEYIMDVVETDNHDFIFGGLTKSSNGNLSLNYGNNDAWVGRVSGANGTLLWNYNYGGSGDDIIMSICKVTDGSNSIAAVGTTDSPNDYNVSGNHGDNDIWMITFDETNGIYTWGNCFGGSAFDDAVSVKTTFDKGYIIAATTMSLDGNVSYNADAAFGQVWVLKLNNARTIDWEQTYGGPATDGGIDAYEKSDGGYFVAAETNANGGDVSGWHGSRDYWAVKLSGCFKPPVSTATITANGPTCGGNVTLTVPGGPAYTYQWKQNGSNVTNLFFNTYFATTPGNYTCTVSNIPGCGSTNSPAAIVSKVPVATISPSGTVNKCAATVVNFLANSGSGLTYQWYRNNAVIAGATNRAYNTKKPGKYKVYVYNPTTSCGKFSTVTTVNNTCKETFVFAGAADENNLQSAPAALLEQNTPNPFISNCVIRYSLPQKFTTASIVVTDITGRTVKQFMLSSAGNGSININAGMLAQGTYTYTLYVDGKFIDSKHMVITK